MELLIYSFLRCQDPLSVSNSVAHMLQEMEGKSRTLKSYAKEALKLLKVNINRVIHAGKDFSGIKYTYLMRGRS